MHIRSSTVFVAICALVIHSPAFSWGSEGHAAVGIMAMELTDQEAKKQLQSLLGDLSNERMEELCNWPDAMREIEEWNWASPQHYVNLPRSATRYEAERDCRDGLCATEAIKKYAAELGNDRLGREQRKQAFAWLCHLVGDLHQPLHCGFADDRGGNQFGILFENQALNLHEFWDHTLIEQRAGDIETLVSVSSSGPGDTSNMSWNPLEVNLWTEQSHLLAIELAYPENPEISPEFADQTWEIIKLRLSLAAERLALILNAVLGEGEVKLGPVQEPLPGTGV